MCPTPVPPTPGKRPVPPAPTTRPTPPAPSPSRPTPPAATPEKDLFVGSDVMAFLTKTVDRDDNNTIEDNEARITGRVGNDNGRNGIAETARALNAGNAMLYGFQLARNAAEAIAKKLAGGNNWISRDDMPMSDAARARIDQNGDNRITVDEFADALQRGGIAINAKEVMLTDEAKAKFNRPTPPAPDTDRPRPPRPDVDRPPPPPVDRPTPPVAVVRTPQDITERFSRAYADLKRVYDTTSMSRVDFDAATARMLTQAVRELTDETQGAPFAQRKAALDAFYNGTSMSRTDRDEVERTLVQQECTRIIYGHFASYADRRLALESVYNNSKMSTVERDDVGRRLEAEEARRATRF